jgi:type IV secretory pathway VirB6-like protein
MGIATTFGRVSVEEATSRVLRMIIVVLLVAPGAIWYQTYIVSFFLKGIPSWSAGLVSSSIAASGPADAFDNAFFQIWALVWKAWLAEPLGFFGTIFDALVLGVCLAILVSVLVVMFAVFLVIQALMAVLVCLGPVIAPLLLFNYTKLTFDLWVGAMIGFSLASIAVNIMVALVIGILATTIATVASAGGTANPLLGLASMTIVIVTLGAALRMLPRVIERVGGASGVPSMDGSRWMMANIYSRLRIGRAGRGT